MMEYVATFFSHYSAVLSKKALDRKGISSKLAPTPRKVSSSCGTCLLYESDGPCEHLMDDDFEAVYEYDTKNDSYIKIIDNEIDGKAK